LPPSPQAEQRLRDRLREILNRRTGCRPVPEVVGEVNAVLRGWTQYFYHGQPQLTMKRIKFFAEQRLRKWLMRRRHQRGPGYTQYPSDTLYSTYGLYKVPTSRPGVSRMPPAKETPRAGCRKPARPVR
jgi:RNA-directed DNA polymerase